MSVKVGDPAPAVELFDDQRSLVRLADYRGDKNVLLLFFPGAFTSVCTDELNTVNNELDEYGADTQVVAASTDSPFVLAEFKKVHKFQFPLLSDHEADVSAAFGSKYDHDFTDMRLDRIAKRSAFVIDKDGVVRYAEVLDNAGQLPDFDQIKRTLSQ